MSLVDIILPIYKAEQLVYESIESVISQNYTNWHLYIVDDASNDNRLAEIKSKYADLNGKITYHQFKTNRRAAACRNYAISLGKGKFIAFIDQDDVWLHDKLQSQIDKIESSGADAVHGNIQFINYSSNIIWPELTDRENKSRQQIDWENTPKIALANKLFITPNIRIISTLINRDIFEKIGGFKDEYFGGEDELFWFEIAYHGRIGYLNKVLISRRVHENNTVTIFRSKRYVSYYNAINYLHKKYKKDIVDSYKIKEKYVLFSLINLMIKEKNFLFFKYLMIAFYRYPTTTITRIIKNISKR